MKNPNSEKRWKEVCRVCNKTHIVHRGLCPNCGVYETVQPVSENISCGGEICEACEAYDEHYLPW